MEVLQNIVLGAIGSIVATIILFVCSSLYKIGYKEELRFDLARARIATYQIQNQHLFPEDYALVLSQVDILHQCAFNMYHSLRPLSMPWKRKNRKLIITVLYDIIQVCEMAKFTTVGYSGLDEKEARLKQIHKYFYKYAPLAEVNSSTVIVQLDVIENLLSGNSMKKAIHNAFGRLADELPLEDLVCDGFISISSLRQGSDRDMRKRCFTRGSLERVLR